MSLIEKQFSAHEAKRATTRENLAKGSKTVGQLLLGLHKTAREAAPNKEVNMAAKWLKAKCMRLAGRSTVIGQTAFAFDIDGLCKTLDQGNARVDYQVLIAQNGVTEVMDAPMSPTPRLIIPAMPKSAPVKVFEETTNGVEEDMSPPDLIVPEFPKGDLKKKIFKKS